MKKVLNIAFIGVMASLIFASQVLLAGLPNIELVSAIFLVIALALNLSTSMMIAFIFVMLEGLYWGFADWVIGYLYIWPLFILVVYLLKKRLDTPLKAAFISGAFGLLFGTLFSLQHLVLFGPKAALAYILSGISFDVVHGVGNFILMLALFEPLKRVILLVRSKVEVDKNEGKLGPR